MGNDTALSIILPAYLEEENLRILLPRLYETVSKLVDCYEIIVVDTLTPMDNTRDICLQQDVIYLNREGSNSFGDAVRTGIKHAKGEYVLFMDADGSHPPEFIRTLWQNREGSDIVIASRYIEGGATDNSKLLIVMSLIVNLLYSLVLNLNCKDVSNSFKLYHGQLLKELNLHCKNFDIVEEILFKIKKRHKEVRIREIPFSFKKRMFGNTKRNLVFFVFSFLVTLIRLRFNK